MTLHFRVAICFALFAFPALAADPPSIDKLIEQLGSRSFAERERATKALRERGPEALPAVRKALQSTDEEVRKRAESLVPALEIAEALLPKRITIKSEKMSVADALKEMAKQTGFKFGPAAADNRSLSLDLKDVPFWDAMEEIGRQPVSVYTEYSSKERTLNTGTVGGKSPHLLVRGPFRLEATWFHEDRDVDLRPAGKEAKKSSGLTLSVSVYAEPRITIQKISTAVVEEAIDSEGNSLLEPVLPDLPPPDKKGAKRLPPPAPPTTAPAYPSGRGTFRGESLTYSDIRLRRKSETAKTLKLVRGTIHVQTILIRKPVVVTSKLMESTGTSFKAGNEGLQITRVTNQGGNSIEVQILVPYERNGDWSRYEQWYQRFHVEDDAGNKYQDHGRGSSSNGNQYWLSMYFGQPNGKAAGPPTKLIFEDWVIHDHTIPFEFKDVPMP